jgi:hypothetical protein
MPLWVGLVVDALQGMLIASSMGSQAFPALRTIENAITLPGMDEEGVSS